MARRTKQPWQSAGLDELRGYYAALQEQLEAARLREQVALTELVTVRASAQEREASLRTQWGTDVKNLQAEADKLRKQRDEERKSHALTKGDLMSALLVAERLGGYLDAIRDATPVPMVPDPSHTRALDAGRFNLRLTGQPWGNNPPGTKQWFER